VDKNMKMSLRWFGKEYDSITLKQIRQIPGVGGVIPTLYNRQPGEDWPLEEIRSLKKDVEEGGLASTVLRVSMYRMKLRSVIPGGISILKIISAP